MKIKVRTLMAVVLVVVLLTVLVPTPALAKENKTPVTGTLQMQENVPDDFPEDYTERLLGNGKMYLGLFAYDLLIISDDRLCGYETVDWHGIIDWQTGSGIVWGSIELVTAGGSWSGHFTGKIENFNHTYHVTFVGKGPYQGLVASLDYAGYQEGGNYDRVFEVTGYIVETGANK